MRRRVGLAAIVMGISGLVAEILLLRELLIVFSGNELSIGIILANWLILEALGSLISGRLAERSRNVVEAFAVITILFSASLPLAVFLTRILRSVMGVSVGETMALFPVFYASFLILLPVSVLHGALFTLSCRTYAVFSGEDRSAAGRVYVYETVGTIIGGIASTYLLVPHLHAFQASIGLATLNFVVCLVLIASERKSGWFRKPLLVILSALTLLSGYQVFASPADGLHRDSIQRQWDNLNIVHYENSRYGNICVIENEGQYIYFLDGRPAILTPVPDIPFVEEFVHLPLLAHSEPSEILILSGGVGGVINEALKHPSIETIEYAELDPLLLSLFREFPTPLTESEMNDERVKIRHVDGRLLLRASPNQYDVILVGITEPSSLQTNRFFTREFFSLAEARLKEGGILVLATPGSLTFLDEALKDLNSSVFHTLHSVFSYVRVIPGDSRNVFLSSHAREVEAADTPLFVRRLNERGLAADGVVPWRIERKVHHGWQDWFTDLIEGSTRELNHDFKPVGLFYSIAHWNALYAPSFGWLFRQFGRIDLKLVFLLFVLFLGFYALLRSRRGPSLAVGIPFSIVASGFAGMVLSLVVIFAFQSVYGYVFSWIGLLVASFMAGAAGGAWLIQRVVAGTRRGPRLFLGIEVALVGLSMGLPPLFSAINAHAGSESALALSRMLFLVISFTCGLLIGSQFPLANQLYLDGTATVSQTAGLLYAADLLGGWLGGMVGAVVLLPVLGLAGTCIGVGLLKLASFIVLATQPGYSL